METTAPGPAPLTLLHERIQETIDRLDLLPRIREVASSRDWAPDEDLIACMVMAIVCVAEGSPATKLKRPTAVGPDWPAEYPVLKACRVVHLLSLTELLEV